MANLGGSQFHSVSFFKRLRQETIYGYLFIFVPVLLALVFRILPVFASFVLSLFKWNLGSPPKLVGLANYYKMIHDNVFWTSVLNTLYYVAGTIPIGTALALVFALAVDAKWFRGREFIKVVYFTPTVVSMTVISLVWIWIFDARFGLLNDFLFKLGIRPLGWLGDLYLAMPSVIIISIWKSVGYSMVIYLAGLQDIPDQLYEAAKIDGASSWQQFRYITLPLLRPVTLFIVVISVIGAFQVFDQVYLMTGGGPVNATRVIVFYIWQNAFQQYQMGYASGMAWGLFAMIFFFTLFQFRLFSSNIEY